MLKENQSAWASAGIQPSYAAIDLGTNNCRMLIARPTATGFSVVDAFSRVVRLGEGMSNSQFLQDEAMERALAALRICARKMRRRGVRRARGVATEACRRASNGASFLRQAEVAAGIAVEVIGPDEEASLALAGCRTLLNATRDRGLLVDIGGGSTQIVWFSHRTGDRQTGAEVLGMLSLPMGVVSLTERYGERAPQEMFAPVDREISSLLVEFDAEHGISSSIAANRVQAIGTSGTITTVAGLVLGLERYERARVDGSVITCEEIERTCQQLARMTLVERSGLACVGALRADMVVAGCAVLSAICRLWPVDTWTVADRGLREGILLDLIAADGHPAD